MLGTLLSGQLIRRIGFGKTLFVGYVLMGLYVVEVWTAPWPWLASAAFVNGIGLGLVIPATNMAVSDAFPDRRAAALNLLNLFWSAGAIVCPTLLAAAARKGQLAAGLSAIAVLLFAVALLALRSRGGRAEATPQMTGTISRVAFVVLAALFFLYIGSEAAVAGWLATYAKRTVLSSGFLWMTAPSFFWAAMLLGRAAAPVILRKVNESSAAFGGLMLAAAGIGTILLGTSPVIVLGGAALSGLGMSSVFPIFIAMVSHLFRESATRVSSYMFAMAALGGAVLPWLVGTVSSHTGRLQIGLIVALVGTLVQVVLIRTLPSNQN
jgi:fucose permease